MAGKKLLRDLIDHYLVFSESDHRQDLASFSDWLHDHSHAATTTDLEPKLQREVEHKGLQLAIAEYWGRLSQYAVVWSKMAFQELPVKTFAEYGLLKYISMSGNPTKTELVELSMLEKSTCYEIIRRLQQMELVEEEQDSGDRRIRRVKLSEQGRQWVLAGDEQLAKISRVLVGDLNREHQIRLLELLVKLNDFHTRLYRQDTDRIREHYF